MPILKYDKNWLSHQRKIFPLAMKSLKMGTCPFVAGRKKYIQEVFLLRFLNGEISYQEYVSNCLQWTYIHGKYW